MALKWNVGANGNLFADGRRPNGTPNFVRYCIGYPYPAGAQNFPLLANGYPISDHVGVAAAKAAAEREAAGKAVAA